MIKNNFRANQKGFWRFAQYVKCIKIFIILNIEQHNLLSLLNRFIKDNFRSKISVNTPVMAFVNEVI